MVLPSLHILLSGENIIHHQFENLLSKNCQITGLEKNCFSNFNIVSR